MSTILLLLPSHQSHHIVVNTIATATVGVSQLTWCELWLQILVYTTNRVLVAIAER